MTDKPERMVPVEERMRDLEEEQLLVTMRTWDENVGMDEHWKLHARLDEIAKQLADLESARARGETHVTVEDE